VQIRGTAFQRSTRGPFFLGTIPPEAFQTAAYSAQHGLEAWRKLQGT